MRHIVIVALLISAFAACANKERRSTTTDTTITNIPTKDTTIVRRDSMVKVDTLKQTDHKSP